jgi:hypothetical protein
MVQVCDLDQRNKDKKPGLPSPGFYNTSQSKNFLITRKKTNFVKKAGNNERKCDYAQIYKPFYRFWL